LAAVWTPEETRRGLGILSAQRAREQEVVPDPPGGA